MIAKMLNSNSTVAQFILFSTIGLFNTGVDFTCYFLFTRYTPLGNTKELSIIALILAFIISNIIAFGLHNRITFHSSSSNFKDNYWKFLIVSVGSLIINIAVFSAALYILNLNDIIAKAIAVVVVVGFSFAGNKLWAFKAN